jgi:23S rRNA (uracil1939-C5)-methyltransferase
MTVLSAIAPRVAPSEEPNCPHAPRCPGCPLIGKPYEAGLRIKSAQLTRALGRYSDVGRAEPEPIAGASSIVGYRVRAKLVADAEGRLGLFAAGTHECRVLTSELFEAAAALRALLPLEVPVAGVDLRLTDRGVLVCLITDGQPKPEALARTRQRVLGQVPRVVGLALNVRRPGAVQLLGPEQVVLAGAEAEPHHLTSDGPWHYASHGAFTQVHPEQTTRLHERIERAIEVHLGALRDRRVLELYAGSGALGLRLAAKGARVTAVETFEPALRRLGWAARDQSLPVETFAEDAEDFLARKDPAASNFDVVLVNPPRRGLSPDVRTALAASSAKLLVYVSCNPETLARDLSHLGLIGWHTTSLAAFDLIPLSDSLETLAILTPDSPPAPRIVFEDAQSIALFKLPFEPTTPQGQSAHSLLARARRTLGLPELTPIHGLDLGTSGVCWFARQPSGVPSLARALARGQKTYLSLARGVLHKKGKISRPLLDAGKPRQAVTRYRRTDIIGGHSLLELQPEHGRKHQLRRHLASLGHPILGDTRYGQPATNRHFEHRHGLDRPFLHCASLRLMLGSEPIHIEAELPGDLQAVLASLDVERASPKD